MTLMAVPPLLYGPGAPMQGICATSGSLIQPPIQHTTMDFASLSAASLPAPNLCEKAFEPLQTTLTPSMIY